MIAVLWYFPRNQRLELRHGLEEKVLSVSSIISYNLVAAVDAAAIMKNIEPISALIAIAKKDGDLIGIRVEDANGERLDGKDDEKMPDLPPPTSSDKPRIEFMENTLEVVALISQASEDKHVGILRMSYSLEDYYEKESDVLFWGILLGLSIFIFGSLLAMQIGKSIAGHLGTMTHTFQKMAQGDLAQEQLRTHSSDEVGQLSDAFNALLLQMKELSEHAQAIANGDLSREITTKGDLADAFRTMTNSISILTSEFMSLSAIMRDRTADILATAKQQEAGASQQAATVSEVTSTMEELAATARQIANNAESVTSSAEKAAGAVVEGQLALSSFTQSIDSIEAGNKTINDNIVQLNRYVQQIGGIIDLINDIADRSDLLALNAALEGTKAGQAGKGFLLVAAEMRRLAENVFNSTAEIKQLISEVTEATNSTVMATESGMRTTREGVERAGEAEKAFTRIIETIEETSKAAKQISLATQQQHTGTEQIVAAMGEVAEVSHRWVEGIGDTTRSVSELSTMTSQLNSLVEQYRSS
jgi:methyl-accepting chemotaxis protein